MLSGLPSDVDTGPNTKLGKDVRDVGPDGARREHKLLSDLPVGHPLSHHSGDLRLGRRETVPPGLRLPMLGPRPAPDPVLAQLSPEMGKVPVGAEPIVKLIRPGEGPSSRIPIPTSSKPNGGGLERLGPQERTAGVAIPIRRMLQQEGIPFKQPTTVSSRPKPMRHLRPPSENVSMLSDVGGGVTGPGIRGKPSRLRE